MPPKKKIKKQVRQIEDELGIDPDVEDVIDKIFDVFGDGEDDSDDDDSDDDSGSSIFDSDDDSSDDGDFGGGDSGGGGSSSDW